MRPLTALLLLFAVACGSGTAETATTGPDRVVSGAEVLAASDFALLDGLRVGLIANQTSVVGDRHLADLLAEAPNVTLAALFGPEHGIRGAAADGDRIDDTTDPTTGVTVFSLYGSRREPPDSVLASLDALVFDIQDIGARFYTFISTMGLAMQAAARVGVPFIVLDRPNPLGGTQVDGFIREEAHRSFVAYFPIPIQHGLTVGELAQMARGERWIDGADALDLTVVPARGWTRDRQWPDTGLPWIATSPNIPTFESALVYAGMCLFEGTSANEGRGTERAFLMVGHAALDAGAAATGLKSVPGMQVVDTTYTPVVMPGRATNPRFRDQAIPGLSLHVTDRQLVRPLMLGLQALAAVRSALPDTVALFSPSRLARLAGTDRLLDALARGDAPEVIADSWADEVAAFRTAREPYLLYD